VAMICHTFAKQRSAVLQTWEAIEKEEWSVDDLKASGVRIKKLKDRFAGSWHDVLGVKFDEQRLEVLKKHNLELSKNAYAASIAVLNGPLPMIPKEGKVLLLTPEVESLNKAVDDAEGVLGTGGDQVRNTAGPSYLAFATTITRHVSTSQHKVYSSRGGISSSDITQASVVIFVTRNADRSPWQIDQLKNVSTLALEAGIRVVLLQSCTPYDLLGVDQGQSLVPCIASFEFTPPALEAAAGVLFGETHAMGRIPVMIGQ